MDAELAELNGPGFNYFPNRVMPLICFLGDDHNFGRRKPLQQEEHKQHKAAQNGKSWRSTRLVVQTDLTAWRHSKGSREPHGT